MDHACTDRHPLEAAVFVQLRNAPEQCLLCSVTTIAHGGMVCAIRQAALSSILSLPDDHSQLQTVGSFTLSRLQTRLLSTLLSVSPPPPAPLARQLCDFLCHLSTAADSAILPSTTPTSSAFVSTLITTAVSAILKRASIVSAVPLLAGVLSSKSSQTDSTSMCISLTQKYLSTALGCNALTFVRKLLSRTPDATSWPSIATVLNACVRAAPLTLSPIAVISLIPPPPTLRAHTTSTGAYLTIMETFLDVHGVKSVKVLLHPDSDFISIVRHALLCTDAPVHMLSANVIAELARLLPSAASTLVQSGVADYLVEALRSFNPTSGSTSANQIPALIAFSHIASQCPDVLVSKWSYALTVITAFCKTIPFKSVPSLLIILQTAFQTAATPVFSYSLIQQVVALFMRIVNQISRTSSAGDHLEHYKILTNTIDCLIILLSRCRFQTNIIHTILSVVEVCANYSPVIASGIRLLHACAAQFCQLAKIHAEQSVFNDTEGQQAQRLQREALSKLAKQLIYVQMDVYGPILHSKIGTLEGAKVLLGNTESIFCALKTFTVMMHPAFVRMDGMGSSEHFDMRWAFWNILPLRIVFDCLGNENTNRSDEVQILHAYIARILGNSTSFDNDTDIGSMDCLRVKDFPNSATDFLTKLSEDLEPLDNSVAFNLLQHGISFSNVQNICENDVIIDALSKRLDRIMGNKDIVNASIEWQNHIVVVLTCILAICRRANMVFPADCLRQDVVRVFTARCRNISCEETFSILSEIICLKRLEGVHADIWEKLADNIFSVSTTQWEKHKLLFYRMCENNPVVLESAVNTILMSSKPGKIAKFISFVYRGHAKSDRGKAISRRELIQKAVQQLSHATAILKGAHKHHGLEKLSAADDHEIEHIRTSALLDVIVNTNALYDTAASWSLLRALTELLPSIDVSISTNHAISTLHASVLHSLVQMMSQTKDTKRLMYMIETGGVLKHCIDVLKAVPLTSVLVWKESLNENILSHIGHSLLLMLEIEDASVQKECLNVLLRDLSRSPDIWECILTDHLEQHELMTAVRISYYIDLMLKVYIAMHKSSAADQFSFISGYVLTHTCVWCLSPRPFLRNRSLLLLSELLKKSALVDVIPKSILGALARLVLSRVISIDGLVVSNSEIKCAARLVACGKIDQKLAHLHNCLYHVWTEWRNLSVQDDDSPCEYDETRPLTSVTELFFAVRERISVIDASNKGADITVEKVSEKDLKAMRHAADRPRGTSQTNLHHSQLYFVNDPHAFRVGAS